jgi:hypothetical protein
MAHYRETDLAENRQRFRHNRNPGPGVVQGIGKLGTLQQVLWYPEHDTRRHDMVFKKDPASTARLTMQTYSRRGNLLAEQLVMDSVATAGYSRHIQRIKQLSHFVTTSSYGTAIAAALHDRAVLPQAILEPETDRYRTRGVSGLIVPGASAAYQTGGKRDIVASYLHLHNPRPHGDSQSIVQNAARYDTISEANFEPGVGIGLHAYEGVGRQPFTGNRYAFPLGSTAENTLDIYHDLLGKRRGVNIAVKELLGSGAMALVAANASGEPA